MIAILSLPKLCGAFAVFLFIGLIAVLNMVEPQLPRETIFDLPLLIPSLNTILLTAVAFAVAFISARGYLATGSVTLLFLGVGIFTYGVAVQSSWLFNLPDGANIALTIANTEYVIASILSAIGVVLAFTSTQQTEQGKKSVVYTLYPSILIITVILTYLTFQEALPPFFIPGVGGTPIRQAILSTAIGLFAFSSIGIMYLYAKKRSDILYWWGLTLALLAVGLSAFFFQRSIAGPIGWVGRIATWIGGISILIQTQKSAAIARAKKS